MAVLSRQIEDKYEILEEIASGGMGSIYKVRHRLLNEERVIKVMRPQMEEDEGNRERFLREARFAIRLRDQNIAQLYDFSIDDDGTYHIVMEYIRGMNLEEILKSTGPPKIGLSLEIACQSLRALGVLHHQGFVHRDVSPDNLMLTQDLKGRPLVKLIDLGIAKPMAGERNLTQTGLFMGKVRYASPEHFGGPNGNAAVETRSDLYSFGVVLYELLTGRYPVSGTNISSLVAGHLFQPPLDFSQSDPEKKVPQDLRDLVLKAISKDVEDRYADADRFAEALREIQIRIEEDEGEAQLDPAFLTGRPAAGKGGKTMPAVPLSEASSPPPPTQIVDADERQTVVHGAEEIDAKADRARERQAERAAEEVRQLLDEGQLDRATEALAGHREVLESAGHYQTFQRRLGELLEERRRAEELAAAMARVEGPLEDGDLDAAESALQEAEERFQNITELVPLRERLDGLRRERQVADHLTSAREQIERREFDGAIAELERARELDPGHREIDELRRTAEKAAARAAELQGILLRIEPLLTPEGDLRRARRELEKTARRFPEAEEELALLERSLEELEEVARRDERRRKKERQEAERRAKEAEARERDERRKKEAAERERREAEARREKEARAREREERRERERQKKEAAKREREEKAAADEERLRLDQTVLTDDLPQVEAPARDAADAGQRTQVIPLPRPERPTPDVDAVETARRPAARRVSPAVVAGAAGLVALLALVGWLLVGRDTDDRPVPAPQADLAPATPEPAATDPGPSTAAVVGKVTLDALPWGRVVEIVDADGTSYPAGEDPYTPIVLELPPGRYTISLSNPNFSTPRSVEIDVDAAQPVSQVVEFRRVDVDRYFQKAGW